MVQARRDYKKTVRNFNYEQSKINTNKLLAAKYKNAKLNQQLQLPTMSSVQTSTKGNVRYLTQVRWVKVTYVSTISNVSCLCSSNLS